MRSSFASEGENEREQERLRVSDLIAIVVKLSSVSEKKGLGVVSTVVGALRAGLSGLCEFQSSVTRITDLGPREEEDGSTFARRQPWSRSPRRLSFSFPAYYFIAPLVSSLPFLQLTRRTLDNDEDPLDFTAPRCNAGCCCAEPSPE